MNRGTALKWIDILRSGRYTAGSGQLRYENQFCAYGVLCDFLDPNGWSEIKDNQYGNVGFLWHGSQYSIPEQFRKKCKMKSEYGDFISENKLRRKLVDVIDASQDHQIVAYYIEQYYEQL